MTEIGWCPEFTPCKNEIDRRVVDGLTMTLHGSGSIYATDDRGILKHFSITRPLEDARIKFDSAFDPSWGKA